MPKKAQSPRVEKGRNYARSTITAELSLLKWAKEEAEKDGRTFSNWISAILKERKKKVEAGEPGVTPAVPENPNPPRNRRKPDEGEN